MKVQYKKNKKITSLIREVQKEMIALFGHKLKTIYLFGSYARGDSCSESDIDFFLVIDGDSGKYEDQILDISLELSLKYESVVSIFLENQDIFNKYLNVKPLYKNVYNEGIEIYAA